MQSLRILAAGVSIAVLVLPAACGTKPPPAPTTPPQNVTGILTEVNTPTEPGSDVVIVQTPQGTQSLPIAANTTFSLEGKICTLDQLDALNTANVSYNCAIVLDVDGIVVDLDVTKTVP